MKKPVLILLFLSQSIFADPGGLGMDVKGLKVGQMTLEALGEIKSSDTDGFSAIRQVKCLAPTNDGANKTEGFPNDPPANEAPLALILYPGSKIKVRRTVLNEYSARFRMNPFVLITCD